MSMQHYGTLWISIANFAEPEGRKQVQMSGGQPTGHSQLHAAVSSRRMSKWELQFRFSAGQPNPYPAVSSRRMSKYDFRKGRMQVQLSGGHPTGQLHLHTPLP